MKLIFALAILAIIFIGISNLIKSKNNKSVGTREVDANGKFVILNQQRENISHLHDQHARVVDEDCNHHSCDSHDSGGCDSGSDGGCSGGCD